MTINDKPELCWQMLPTEYKNMTICTIPLPENLCKNSKISVALDLKQTQRHRLFWHWDELLEEICVRGLALPSQLARVSNGGIVSSQRGLGQSLSCKQIFRAFAASGCLPSVCFVQSVLDLDTNVDQSPLLCRRNTMQNHWYKQNTQKTMS